VTGAIVRLGPFGGAHEFSGAVWPWTLAYLGVVGVIALWGFSRRDL